MCFVQSEPVAFLVTASKDELIIPKTMKTPPTIAQILIKKRETNAFDFVIYIDTGENSKIIMTILSSGCSSAGFLLIVSA